MSYKSPDHVMLANAGLVVFNFKKKKIFFQLHDNNHDDHHHGAIKQDLNGN